MLTTAVSWHLLVSHATKENRDTTLSVRMTARDPFHCLFPVRTWNESTITLRTSPWLKAGLSYKVSHAVMQALIQQTVSTLYMAKHIWQNQRTSPNLLPEFQSQSGMSKGLGCYGYKSLWKTNTKYNRHIQPYIQEEEGRKEEEEGGGENYWPATPALQIHQEMFGKITQGSFVHKHMKHE